MPVKIGIVGAGIIGLSSAICIQRACSTDDVEITLITEKLSPFTTGDGAAGMWSPFLLGNTPPQDIYRWSKATHDFLFEQWRQEDGGLKGISMLPVMRVVSEVEETDPFWSTIVFGFQRMKNEDLHVLRKPSLRTGYSFVTFTCEASKLLPHFLEMFIAGGGRLRIERVESIAELGREFEIVINCTGLGARELYPPDPTVVPKRGQVMRVIAPSIKWAILDDDDDGNYVIPNQGSTILGGTHQEGDWNTKLYPSDTAFIKDGCSRIIPSLKYAPILREWVGLRPCRPTVRLEVEKVRIPMKGKEASFTVVHNYGHGGSGLTLFWGCGLQAAALVQDALREIQGLHYDNEPLYYVPKSKL